ncbi:MAG: serine hydrolase [Leucobacter sp.]
MARARTIALGAGLGSTAAGAVWLWRNQGEIATRRPVNEWTFTHMNRVMPTEAIPRPATCRGLAERGLLPEIEYAFDGRVRPLSDLHRRTHTTSFLVVHRGRVLAEQYPGRFAHPGTRFQCYSLSKSITSMLIGIAIERGEIGSIEDPVTRYRPELSGSAYDGPTIAHLLDMTSGAGGLEDWTVPDAPILRFQEAVTTGGSVLDVIRSLPRVAEPGTAFNYSTMESHVLGWVVEAATGRTLAQLASERLWQPMGAEHDGYYFLTRGRPRTALGGGSLNASARDLARLGLIMANGGRSGSEPGAVQIVPEAWVERSRGSAAPHLQVGALVAGGGYEHYGYANQWWTLGGPHREFTGLGVHGQYLWVDPDRETVIVKTSAWNTADDEARDLETVAAFRAITAGLAEDGDPGGEADGTGPGGPAVAAR